MKTFALLLTLVASTAAAQDTCPCPPPPPPPPSWTGSLGAGLALTGGNSDTESYNLSFNALYDRKQKNLFRADGLYLHADADGEAITNSSSLSLRDEYKVAARVFLFGEVRYYRDTFKDIDYLISPLVGVGVNVINEKETKLSFDVGVGGQIEKDQLQPRTSDGAVSAGQRLRLRISDNARLYEGANALWKMNDFGDALYRFEIGLSASISKRMEMKLGFRDDYKTRPPRTTIKKNDTSILATIVFKIA